jgi:uncharacterized protein YmfQ (DUF2313 family)
MAMNQQSYASQLAKLLPRGLLWAETASNKVGSLIDAMATEMARIDARSDDMLNEADPRTTFELLPDWERNYGLPENCSLEAQNLQERIESLVAKVNFEGSLSIPFFIELAASIGFEITITEFDVFTVDSDVDQPLNGIEWRYTWQVNAPEETITYFTVDSDVDMPLAKWGNQLLECTFNRTKPAHTTILFAYGGQN